MKIITLWQPWASLVAYGLKQYETRSWTINYRGKILIHAAKRDYGINSHEEAVARKACELAGWGKFERRTLNFLGNLHPTRPRRFHELPFGCIVAIADLVECRLMVGDATDPDEGYAAPWEIRVGSVSPLELAVGDWSPGRYAWKLENVQRLEHEIEWKGGQGLRNAPPELVKRIEGQLSSQLVELGK